MHRAWRWSLALLLSAAAAQAANVVAYGPATDEEVTYATDAGHTVTVWDEATWQGASAADFAPFDAILVGDDDCGDPTEPSGLFENAALWGPLVVGNVVMHGHDDHNSPENNYDGLIVNCTDFASAGNGLGLCISIQCTTSNLAPEGGVPFSFTIPGMGDFEIDGQDGDGIEIVLPEHPAMAGLTDADLDCWGNSVHEHIQSFPSEFVVLAADNGLLCEFVGPESGEGDGGVTGPVIIARGALGTIMAIPTLSSVALALLATALAAASILVLRRRIRI